MAKVIVRDPFIAGCDRWKTNERAKASRRVDFSARCRVSARPLRLLLATTGLVPSTLQRTHGNRTSITATRTTTIRTIQTMLEPSGGGAKNAV